MTFNAASRLRSLEDRSAALGSSRCELPGMHSVPKSAVLPYASGVGGLSRRLLITKRLKKILSPHSLLFAELQEALRDLGQFVSAHCPNRMRKGKGLDGSGSSGT